MTSSGFGKWVEIDFDCLPLRGVARFDVPDDASPKLADKMLRIRNAVDTHGVHNTYYLHNATCTYHLTNDVTQGMLKFRFEGVVFTDEKDLEARNCQLEVELLSETCDWLNQGVVSWLSESVSRSVLVEFNRYIQAGDLRKTVARVEELQKATEESGGFMGMYL